MEIKFLDAIKRFETVNLGEEYAGKAWDFRWGKDKKIYHWHEFKHLYKSNADAEWSFATRVINFDGSFFVPVFLLEQIECDL